MGIEVFYSENPRCVLNKTNSFLSLYPVHHHLVLSLLLMRIADGEAGLYWVATESQEVVGVAVQSPLDSLALVTPMTSRVISEIVDVISDAKVALPGVAGDVQTAACFAAQWVERNRKPAFPFLGLRLYEVHKVQRVPTVNGTLRKAFSADREGLIDWFCQYSVDIGEKERTTDKNELQKRRTAWAKLVDKYIAAGHIWIWEDVEPVSMVTRTTEVSGVVQLRHVWTPNDKRKRGYASACVAHLSTSILNEGHRCILYTDLCNPSSNIIFRSIGYEAVAEAIQYRFA